MTDSAHITLSSAGSADRPFGWRAYDARRFLPATWDADILSVARHAAVRHELVAGASVTSREEPGTVVTTWTVDGLTLAQSLPWLTDAYRGVFTELAREAFGEEKITPAADPHYGLNLNVMHGWQRYEAHVDTGLQGILAVTTHAPASGGGLTVANCGDVQGVGAIEADPTVIWPVAGQIIFFDARTFTHYVRALTDPDGIRTVAAMSFYCPWAPESDRPADLETHLYRPAG